jgi:hypothetical protein
MRATGTASTSSPGGTPPGLANGLESWFTPGRFALWLGLCIVAAFPTVIFGDQSFVSRDFGLFSYPVASYHRERFWHGEIPLWNPLHNFGVPFLAQLNTMTLYPLSLIYLLLPLEWALSFFCLVHLFIAGMGMFFLCRRWTGSGLAAAIAGTAFAFNGLSLNFLMWPSHEATYAWMPWVVWAVERGWQQGGRNLVWGAALGAMQMLSGAPETFVLTWLVLSALWLAQWISGKHGRGPMLWRFPAMVALVAGLAAAQILPFLDLMAHAQRSAENSTVGWSMPASGWGNFLVPLFGCILLRKGFYAQEHQDWTSSYYAGIGIVALAVLAVCRMKERRVRALGATAALGVLLAMGTNGFVFKWLKSALPMLGFMNHPIKFVLLAVFALSLLAGFGVVELGRFYDRDPKKAARWLLWLGAGAAALVAALLASARFHPADQEDWAVTVRNGLTRLTLLFLILGVFWFVLRARQRRGQQFLSLALVALFWADVITHAPNQNPTAHRAALQPGLVKLSPAPLQDGARAFVTFPAINQLLYGTTGDAERDFVLFRNALFLDCNMLDDIPTIGGFYSLYLKSDLPIRAVLGSHAVAGPDSLKDFAGVAWQSAPDDPFTMSPRTNYLPMITAGQQPVFMDATNTLRALDSNEFRPLRVVYLPPEARNVVTVTNPAEVRIVSQIIHAEKIEIELEARAPSLVVAAQSFYHPWRVWVNDRETPILQANYHFQAWQVPAGHSRVRLEYKDRAFEIGAVLCGISLAICAGIWFISPRLRGGSRSAA